MSASATAETAAIVLREATAADHGEIHRFVKTAFATAKVSNGTEQDFVDGLHASAAHVPALERVAVAAGEIVGHVMLTRFAIDTDVGPRPVLLLAPLAVALEHRRAGLGARLMNDVLERARRLGDDAVVLVGDPAYYGRFGFGRSADRGITNRNGIPDQYVLVADLVPGALDGVCGTVTF